MRHIYDNFLNDFTKLYDECCPVKTRRKRTDFRQKWMTPALLKSCKTKDKLYKKYQQFPTSENKQSYCAFNNQFTVIKRKAEKFYFQNKLDQAKGDLRKTWQVIKDAINKKQKDCSYPDSFKCGGKLISSAETRELSSGNIIKFQERIQSFDWSYITDFEKVAERSRDSGRRSRDRRLTVKQRF